MSKNAKERQFSIIDDPEFVKLFLRLFGYRISGRQIKYLLWKYYWRLTDREIAKLDGKSVSNKAINLELNNAYRKIRHDFSKSRCIL